MPVIDFTGGHTTVIGITRSGKTYATQKSLAAQPKGVLFFNTQYEDLPGYTQANKQNDFKQLARAIQAGKKINYLPSTVQKEADVELAYLVSCCYDYRDNLLNGILAVDEVHLWNNHKRALKELIRVATTGLRFGITGVWISQRPALIDNTLMSQSNQFIIFDTNMEASYFKRYGIPHEDIQARIEQGGQYSFCRFDSKTVTGPVKV